MRISLLHRTIFTFILSGIMSASMTYLVSSFYCEPEVNTLLDIWGRVWLSAFAVILILSPFLHAVSSYLSTKIQNK